MPRSRRSLLLLLSSLVLLGIALLAYPASDDTKSAPARVVSTKRTDSHADRARSIARGAADRASVRAFRPVDGGVEADRGSYHARIDRRGARLEASIPGSHGVATIAVHTHAIARGGSTVEIASASPVIDADAQGVTLARATGIEEAFVARPTGIEQRWTFASEPRGRGDLVVSVDVEDAPLVARTDGGLHFRAEEAPLGFRYGRATWVDARGVETEVEARYAHGTVELRVPARVLAESRYPAVLDPVLGPEVMLDVPSVEPRLGNGPLLACGGPSGECLGVFSISRPDGYHIYGVRLASDGSILDAPPIEIASSSSSSLGAAAVLFDGANFVVGFVAPGSGVNGADPYVRRIAPDGTLLGSAPIDLCSCVGDQGGGMAFATDGSAVLVAFYDAYTGGGIRTVLLGSNDTVSPTGGLLAIPGADSPVLDFDGTGYALFGMKTNSGARNVIAARLDATNVVNPADVGGRFLVPSTTLYQGSPGVVFDGTNHFVVYEQQAVGYATDIYGVRVGTDLVPLASDVTGRMLVHRLGDQLRPRVAFTGANYVVTYDDLYDPNAPELRSMRVALDAMPFPEDASGRVVATNVTAYVPAPIVFDGTYARTLFSGGGIREARIADDGSVVAEDVGGRPIATQADEEYGAGIHIAASDSRYLAVFLEYHATTSWDVRGVLVDVNGTPIRAFDISNEPGMETAPVVDWDGANFVVAWEKYSAVSSSYDIYAARIDPNGNVLASDVGGKPIVVGPSSQESDGIAFNGTDHLVVYTDYSTSPYVVYATRFAKDLSVSSTVAMPGGYGTQQAPDVASDGNAFLVVWQQRVGAQEDVRAALVTPAGAIDPTLPSGFFLSQAVRNQTAPRVAWGAGEYVAVWRDARASTTSSDLYANRVTTAGALLGETAVATFASNRASGQSVTSDGQQFLFAWGFGSGGGQIVRMAANGSLVDAAPTSISPGIDMYFTGVASLGTATYLVGYTRYDGAPDIVATRTFGRTYVEPRPTGQPCLGWVQCQSGICADGVCCATACGNATDDCRACSVAAGGPADGTCGPVGAGTACRAAAGVCDAAESCDGVSLACPSDAMVAAGTTCRASTSECDLAETCTGVSADCPADSAKPEGTECGAGLVGACDLPDVCMGTTVATATCVARVASYGTTCRDAVGTCDAPEACDGLSADCPPDVFAADATPCDDGLVCTSSSACTSGICSTTGSLACDDGDPCTIDACSEPNGCTHVASTTPQCISTDAGIPGDDAGMDSGIADLDAAVSDGGDDAAVASDAGAIGVDAMVGDSGTDGGDAGDDAGSDAGTDAGEDAGTMNASASGCGCRVAGGTSTGGSPVATGGLFGALLALALVRRRKRVERRGAKRAGVTTRFASSLRRGRYVS